MLRKLHEADPAVLALNKMLAAGDDDEEYNAAVAKLATRQATSMQGLRAKWNLLRTRRTALDSGDIPSPEGRALIERLEATIDEAMNLLARESMRRLPRRH